MASAERTYVDPSALRSLYVHDDQSARFCAWRRRIRGSLPITRFGKAELVNSVELAVFRGALDRAQADAAIADFESDVREGRLTLVDTLWRRTLDLAVELSVRHTAHAGTRTLDVLHVATAMTLETTHFVSHDKRQLSLAKAARLKLVKP